MNYLCLSVGVRSVWGGESGHGESVWSLTQNYTGSDQPASARCLLPAPAVPGCYRASDLSIDLLYLLGGKYFSILNNTDVFVFQGEFVACLLALLRQLKDKEYQQLLSRFPTKDELTVKSFSTHYQSTAVIIVIAVV